MDYNFDIKRQLEHFKYDMNRTKVEYQELRKALKKYDEKVMDKYDDLSINFKGCMTEELCYNDIKSYFNERKETVLVINGLFLQNREGNKNEGSEKDFIVVNYTHRYIMVVEGGLQLTFVSISRFINHMTCYKSSALII